ncbi:MAG: N-acetyl-alpha-D-glucosaminyl L-malate synthase BshA [Deltaproteobacteria bacterium]|nr:MAG: N-acetyl-alpha-D-glucosaminyl L-malate synthase BshA [Deltaproteobacteria bacterium]TMQ18955.1 MAG: N-acetyl-alpha-D-glucosaminyl L-malate synthase BshA [Deltaproteobacteria bacterium]
MTAPLRIAVVCYPALGGSGVIASELALGLCDRGHRVHLVATALPERLHATGVRFEQVAVPTSPVFDHAPYGEAVASHLIELARRESIDLVHLHYAVPHAASALLAAQVLGAAAPAMVVTLHGTDVTALGAHPSLHAVTAFALERCAGLTTPSHYLRGQAVDAFGLAPARIEVIPNFVDLERFAPPGRRDPGQLAAQFGDGRGDPAGPVLFHVSNFRPIKRPLDLVEVLARVRRTVPARLILVGDGPERAAVEARARALGVGDAVRALGRRRDFAGLLAHADGFLLTSESESFGVAALEALASGVPVFGYRVGGVPEVVGEGCGTLVARGDVDALAHAVVAGVSDARAHAAMADVARARAEALFSMNLAVERYEIYFRHVLAARTRGSL